MTTIEKIKAEIERRIEHYKEWVEFYKSRGTKSDYDETVLGAYSDLLSFISTLESEKPVPADLEEAADKYAKKTMKIVANGLFDNVGRANGFIAGAKWDREQVMKEAVETVVSLEAGGFPVVEFGVGKFGLKVGDKVKVIIVKEDEK